ncbi:glycosyltransferase family 2 protein [Candidatus Altiarchaeota archaeon]
MLKEKTVAVVVPAYNEEALIEKTLTTIPEFVDHIYVVDDGSRDNTYEKASSVKDSRIILIRHEKNKGVGASIVSGYKKALDEGVDAVAVMAGDAQMSPEELEKVIRPIVDDEADYVKGNRLLVKDAVKKFPRFRFFGNAILTLLTKVASGYWEVMDPQNGYTAISKNALETLGLDGIYPRYGYCNDLLVRLNVFGFRVKDVSTTPIYGKEKSGIRIPTYLCTMSLLLLHRFLWRMGQKYIIRNFHPLVLFYFFGLILFPLGVLIALKLVWIRIMTGGGVAETSAVLSALLIISGLQLTLFAMFFDMQENTSRDANVASYNYEKPKNKQ